MKTSLDFETGVGIPYDVLAIRGFLFLFCMMAAPFAFCSIPVGFTLKTFPVDPSLVGPDKMYYGVTAAKMNNSGAVAARLWSDQSSGTARYSGSLAQVFPNSTPVAIDSYGNILAVNSSCFVIGQIKVTFPSVGPGQLYPICFNDSGRALFVNYNSSHGSAPVYYYATMAGGILSPLAPFLGLGSVPVAINNANVIAANGPDQKSAFTYDLTTNKKTALTPWDPAFDVNATYAADLINASGMVAGRKDKMGVIWSQGKMFVYSGEVDETIAINSAGSVLYLSSGSYYVYWAETGRSQNVAKFISRYPENQWRLFYANDLNDNNQIAVSVQGVYSLDVVRAGRLDPHYNVNQL